MKRCPSLSEWEGKECGILKYVKDSCGCESINCGGVNLIDPPGEWVLLQHHLVGQTSAFNDAKWAAYKTGFGKQDLSSSAFWLGLESMHQLTKEGKWELVVKVKLDKTGWPAVTPDAKQGQWAWAIFEDFSIDSESNKYMLKIGNMVKQKNGKLEQLKSYHNGMPFTTSDRKNDKWTKNCASTYGTDGGGGGWWYNACYHACLNCLGKYPGFPVMIHDGSTWRSVSETIMAMRLKSGS